MSKIELLETNSGYNLQKINSNFQKIEDEFNNKVLYRDNPIGEPNEMLDDLDMNGNRIYNLPTPAADHEAARLKDVQDAVAGAAQANMVGFAPYGSITSTNVQGAIQEVEDKLSGLNDPTDISKGDALVAVKQPYPDSVVRTQHDKNKEILTPEDFGAKGDGVTDDTDAWAALAAAASSAYAKVVARGEYLISGSSVIFSDIEEIYLDLYGAIFRQQNNFSKTITFNNCKKAVVKGGTFYGRGGASGEYNGATGSYNGVAAIYFNSCHIADISGVSCYYHAGSSIGGYDTENVLADGCYIEGIGPDYILPGDNGSDFAFNFSWNSSVMTDYKGSWKFTRNRVFNTAFGFSGFLTKSLIISENDIGPIPGQHGVYTIDCNNIQLSNNIIRDCGELGFKLQLERRAISDFNIPNWDSLISYSVGDRVKYAGSVYDCIEDHVSGAFDPSKWKYSKINDIHGLNINNNIFENCLDGIQIPDTAQTYGQITAIYGAIISDNIIRDCRLNGMVLGRMRDGIVSDNLVTGCGYTGIYGVNMGSKITGNRIVECGGAGIFMSCSYTTDINDNIIENCSHDVPNQDVPLYIFNRDSNAPPDSYPACVITCEGNFIRNIRDGGDIPGPYIMYFGSQYTVTITHNRSIIGHRAGPHSYSLKPIKIDGLFFGRTGANPETAGNI